MKESEEEYEIYVLIALASVLLTFECIKHINRNTEYNEPSLDPEESHLKIVQVVRK